MRESPRGRAPGRGGGAPLFLFDSTSHVLWAEEVAQEQGIPVEVVPAPPGPRGRCGLALETLPSWAGTLETALEEEGIPFSRHS